MLRLVSDADVPGAIVRGLRRHQPDLDIVRVQEVGLRTADDSVLLAWAATEGRILVTRDRQTMIGTAYQRVTDGQPMPRLIVVHEDLGPGPAVEQIRMVAVCCTDEEMKDRVVFLPL
jgi:predicted nuclease of predicted toxin-antitoxin system